MRHGKKFNHLGRKKAHRAAMLSNMACSLIEHKRITTTVAKAKALRVYVEPLITKSKEDSTHSRRTVFSYLKNKYAVTELFREVAPKVANRPGGYTRIIKTGFRQGDAAEMCMIELVDFNEIYGAGDKAKKKRSRRGGGKKKTAIDTISSVAAEAKEAVKDTASSVADKAQDAASAVAETVSDAKDAVVEKAAEVKDAAAEVVQDAKEAVGDAADAVAEKASEMKDAAADKVDEAKDALADTDEKSDDEEDDKKA